MLLIVVLQALTLLVGLRDGVRRWVAGDGEGDNENARGREGEHSRFRLLMDRAWLLVLLRVFWFPSSIASKGTIDRSSS